MEELIEEGRALALYDESEQADQKVQTDILDALWQSIYDVCRLICLSIIEGDKEDEDVIEAIIWLKKCQSSTKQYQDFEIDF